MQTAISINNKATQTIALVNKALQSSPTGVTFFRINNYENKFGEVSNQTINIGASYANAKAADIATLNALDVTTLKDVISSKIELEKARVALIEAFISPNENISKGQVDAYTRINDAIKVHNETGKLYIFGYRVKKEVVIKGTYPVVNSRPATIAKNELRELLKTNNFVNFSIEVGNTLTAKGETIDL